MKLCPKCQKQFSDDANFCPVDAARLVPLETQAAGGDALAAKFELGDRLGGSRTGAVHLAIDRATGLPAAVKIIAPAVVALPGLAQRLERELKQLERVQSAGVAKVLASGKRGDDTWIALELLEDAQTLSEAISARGPIPFEQAAGLIEVIGEALIEAAQVGVVHRDLAPKNILFSGGGVKLINFSLPVPAADKAPGVPEFVAPEQHDGKAVDQRSNLYSLGALYYFVLTGGPVQIEDGAVKPPSSLVHVPAPVDAMILRALDRSPTKRFLTVRQFVDEVSRVARGESDAAAPQHTGPIARPKIEPVQTLLGVAIADGSAAMAPAAAAPAAPVSVTAGEAPATIPDRSPWASPSILGATPPFTNAAAGVAVGAAPVAPVVEPLATMPPATAISPPVPAAAGSGVAAPVTAAPVVAAPVIAAPVIAAPLLPATGGAGAKKAAKSDDATKGKFRETMWFKKGELDAQAAQAAAVENARTGGNTAQDKTDSMPLDERYKDDGTLSRSDKEKYSLRTGATVMTKAHGRATLGNAAIAKVSEDALIGELKRGRNKVLAAIAVAVVVLAVIIFLIVR
jgi:serine/threonine-protein kinase